MDAQAYRTRRGLKPWFALLLRGLGAVLAVLAALVAVFLLSAWIGSSLPRNAGWTQPQGGVRIMIETNGLHTGIVMPVTNGVKDWREIFPSAARPRQDGWMPTHIAVGWGEKEVFLNTPTWADLSPSTALDVALGGGKPLLRVAHYVHPQANEDYRWITLRPDEYARLVSRVEAALPPVEAPSARKGYTSYQPHAVHFDAAGRYTLTNTCNQWVSDTLAHAGVRIGRWTPLSGGVMKWIPAGK